MGYNPMQGFYDETVWVHPDRAISGYRDYRGAGGADFPRVRLRTRKSSSKHMYL